MGNLTNGASNEHLNFTLCKISKPETTDFTIVSNVLDTVHSFINIANIFTIATKVVQRSQDVSKSDFYDNSRC